RWRCTARRSSTRATSPPSSPARSPAGSCASTRSCAPTSGTCSPTRSAARCSPNTAAWPATTPTSAPTPSRRSRSATTNGCWPSRPTNCTASSTSCATCAAPRRACTPARRSPSTPAAASSSANSWLLWFSNGPLRSPGGSRRDRSWCERCLASRTERWGSPPASPHRSGNALALVVEVLAVGDVAALQFGVALCHLRPVVGEAHRLEVLPLEGMAELRVLDGGRAESGERGHRARRRVPLQRGQAGRRGGAGGRADPAADEPPRRQRAGHGGDLRRVRDRRQDAAEGETAVGNLIEERGLDGVVRDVLHDGHAARRLGNAHAAPLVQGEQGALRDSFRPAAQKCDLVGGELGH